MSYYILIWVVLFVAGIGDIINLKIIEKKILSISIIVVVTIFCGLRGDCDNDYYNYVGYFEHAPTLSIRNIGGFITSLLSQNVEFGFMFCCGILKTLGFLPQSIFFLCSILSFAIFWLVSRQFTYLNSVSLFIFFSQFIMALFMQIRFGVCMCFVMYAIATWVNKHYLKSIILFIVAISFHRLAWGCIIALPLLKFNVKTLCIIVVATIFIPKTIVISSVGQIFGLLGTIYSKYLEEGGLPLVSLLLYIIIVLPLLIDFYKNQSKWAPVNILLLKLYLVGMILFNFARIIHILSRVSWTYSMSICFLLPLYFNFIKNNKANRVIVYGALSLYCFLKYIPNLKFFDPYYINLNLF